MAKLVYHLMTDRELKKRVAEAGLPTKGDRKVREQGKKTGSHAKVLVHSLKNVKHRHKYFQTLEWRHREFTLLYNASCDSLHPKPVSELIKALEKSEKIKMSERKKDQVITFIVLSMKAKNIDFIFKT